MTRSLLAALAVLVAVPAVLPAQRGRLDRVRRAAFRNDYIEVGLIGGPVRNTVTGAGPVDARYRAFGGAFLTVPVVGDLRIRPEVLVSAKRVSHSTTIQPPCLPPGTTCDPVVERETGSFTWLEVPVLAELRFPGALGRRSAPRLYAGPFVGVRLSCSITAPSIEGDLVRDCDPESSPGPRYNNGDAGFILGGTIAVGGIGVGARWTRSLVAVAPYQQFTGNGRLIGAKHSTLAVALELTTRLY